MHKYSFCSVWQLPETRRRCWHELVVQRSWQYWWPAFRASEPGGGHRPKQGEELALTVRSPLGYKLNIQLKIADIVPMQQLRVTVSGDLNGVGLTVLEDAGTIEGPGTAITIDWTVATTQAWMNILAPVAAPTFGWAHGKVMADGERRLRAYLSRSASSSVSASPSSFR